MELTKEQMENLKSFLLETFAFTEEQNDAMDKQIPMTQELFESIIERCNELGSDADKIFYRLLKEYPDLTGVYGAKIEKELEERYQQVSALLAESRAQEEESDLVRSIGLAARALQSGSGSEKRLVVVHSGINTCSPLAMQDLPDLTVLGPSTVEELAEADYLADLSGCSVDWYFLGDTAGEQETLSGAQVEALRNFWDTFLTACGGTEITFHSDLPSGNEVENAPGVAVVMPASYDIHQDIPLKVEFKPDSSQFQNEDVARSQLAELADALAVDGGKYLLAGCAADMETVSKEYGQNLGLERAQAVRQLMLELGASEDQLTCLGVGKAVTSVQDTDQAQNRAVWLTPADSALAEEFRAAGIQE